MQYFGFLGFIFAILAYSEVYSLKKRVAALEAGKPGGASE